MVWCYKKKKDGVTGSFFPRSHPATLELVVPTKGSVEDRYLVVAARAVESGEGQWQNRGGYRSKGRSISWDGDS